MITWLISPDLESSNSSSANNYQTLSTITIPQYMEMIADLSAKDLEVLVEKSLFFLENHLQSWKGKLEAEHFAQLQKIAVNRLEEIFAKKKSDFVVKSIRHLKNL